MRPTRFPPASTQHGKPAVVPAVAANPPVTGPIDPETVEFDEEDRLILTAPLAPPPRPVPTIMPPPASRLPRPPVTRPAMPDRPRPMVRCGTDWTPEQLVEIQVRKEAAESLSRLPAPPPSVLTRRPAPKPIRFRP